MKRIPHNGKFPLFPLLAVLYLCIFSFVSFRLYVRIGAFGCGDECINYAAGYFINSGKTLYNQIFFNHQPTLAYISAAIQQITHPADIYHLVLYHRLFVTAYALGMGIFLLWRFGLSAALFLLLYEGTKFYMYGYQFIGEAFIVYPVVYLAGVLWDSFGLKKISPADLYIAAISCSFVIWMREPYAPVAIVLLVSLLWRERKLHMARWAGATALATVLLPFAFLPVGEYLYQVVVINMPAAGAVIGGGTLFSSLARSLLYPLTLFISGVWSYLRFIEIGLGVLFWSAFICWWRERKSLIQAGILFVVLMLSGIRTVPPGHMYFDAFHLLLWYALFIMVTVLFLTSIRNTQIRNALILLFAVFTAGAVFSPRAFVWERIDRQSEFASQYAKYTQYAEAIRLISRPTDTLFLDMWDDIIYWESHRQSSYPMSLYIPVEAGIPRYQALRATMFSQTPPDVYYSCPALQTSYNRLPEDVRATYVQLLSLGKPGCLYVRRTRMQNISADTWQQLGRLGIVRP